MATGANNVPMGRLHPILAAKMGSTSSSSSGSSGKSTMTPTMGEGPGAGSKDPELQRHLLAAKRAASTLFSGEQPRKKKRSRWGEESAKTVLPGLPTVLPANMKEDEQKLYLMHLKIEAIGRKLRTGDFDIPINPAERSPSPEPIYSHDGKRLNTREMRIRKKLEEERHDIVQQATNLNPEYKPPGDYKAPNKKFEDKVFIPQDHHPETNFVGLLIGPRGHTLKQLERDTETKIMIRGKGATKEGKVGRSLLPQPGEDEPLHALITGYAAEAVKKAVDKINHIIQSGIDVPGNDNDLKKLQLMQLAELNGTFKPLDIIKCRNCGLSGHRDWECTQTSNITSSVICTRCGGGGHIASDCRVDLSAGPVNPTVTDRAKMDSEYLSLMQELGESVPNAQTPKPASGGTMVRPTTNLIGKSNPHGVALGGPGGVPPWMQGPPHPGFHGQPMAPPLMNHPGGPPLAPWGVPPGGAPLLPLPPQHPNVGVPLPSAVSSADSTTSVSDQQPMAPWQQAPPLPPPGVPWQQHPPPVMYSGVPPPPVALMSGPPPLPPGAPPPPPPEQNWGAAAPPPPPPPPSDSSS